MKQLACINVAISVYERLKKHCAEKGLIIKFVVEDLIKKYLNGGKNGK